MKLKRRQVAPASGLRVGDGVTAEPGEARIRKVLVTLAMVVGPILLLVLYYQSAFPGLTHPQALDFAQLGRNLSQGRGFTTYVLRPLALTHGHNPLQQPDLVHAPLYPFLLALSFGVAGAKDSTAAMVSAFFYLLTIPVVYLLGARLFNRGVGVATAAVFAVNALLLDYAVSGLPYTLIVFLATSLMLTLHALASSRDAAESEGAVRLPRGTLFLAGTLTAALFLTDYVFFWFIPVVLGVVVWQSQRRLAAAALFLAPVCLFALPWMVRNAVLTGNPMFALRGYEVWMDTKNYYPGDQAYRMAPGDLLPGVGLLKAVVRKLLTGFGILIDNFPQATASWLLAFFLPALFLRFSQPAANVTRRALLLCFGALVGGSLLLGIQMPLMVALIPTMLVFAVAYLFFLFQQANLSRTSMVAASSFLVLVATFPLARAVWLNDSRPAHEHQVAAAALGEKAKRGETCLSDQPWVVAWYADRPAVWMPASERGIDDARTRFDVHWLFLTGAAREYSPEWVQIYQALAMWNLQYAQSMAARRTPPGRLRIQAQASDNSPLVKTLDGFTTVVPAEGSSIASVVAELVPAPAVPKVSAR